MSKQTCPKCSSLKAIYCLFGLPSGNFEMYAKEQGFNKVELMGCIPYPFLSLLSSPSWNKTMRDLVQRDGVYYKKFSDVPFSGKVTGSFNGSITNGKREGAWICYYAGGQLHYKGNYKNGKMEGEWITYHRKGQLNSKGNYKNGKREGEWVEFHDDGQLKCKSNHKNGKREGAWICCYDNGQLFLKGNYKNGKREGEWVEFHVDGQLGNKGNYKNGVKIGNWQTNHVINSQKNSH